MWYLIFFKLLFFFKKQIELRNSEIDNLQKEFKELTEHFREIKNQKNYSFENEDVSFSSNFCSETCETVIDLQLKEAQEANGKLQEKLNEYETNLKELEEINQELNDRISKISLDLEVIILIFFVCFCILSYILGDN